MDDALKGDPPPVRRPGRHVILTRGRRFLLRQPLQTAAVGVHGHNRNCCGIVVLDRPEGTLESDLRPGARVDGEVVPQALPCAPRAEPAEAFAVEARRVQAGAVAGGDEQARPVGTHDRPYSPAPFGSLGTFVSPLPSGLMVKTCVFPALSATNASRPFATEWTPIGGDRGDDKEESRCDQDDRRPTHGKCSFRSWGRSARPRGSFECDWKREQKRRGGRR